MYNLRINNSLAFQGSREIFAREAIENANRLAKPVHETLSHSELFIATELLLRDLECINLQNQAKIDENSLRKNLSESITDIYKKSSGKLSPEN